MISSYSKIYCNGSLQSVENYDIAKKDAEKWVIHHRLEDLGFSKKDLIYLGLYYGVPANELIFMPNSEHTRHHNKGEKNPRFGKEVKQQQRDRQSKSMKGKMIGSNNPAFKFVCPLKAIYMYNVLRMRKADICKELHVGRGPLDRVFKEYKITRKYNRK